MIFDWMINAIMIGVLVVTIVVITNLHIELFKSNYEDL